MHFLLQFLLFILSFATICATTCSVEYPGSNNKYSCLREELRCYNAPSLFSMVTKRNCTWCVELVVTNSTMPVITNKFFTDSFCFLMSVSFSDCQIKTISETAFEGFTTIRSLEILNNKIKDLKFLNYLTDLKYLNLSNNELIQIQAKDFTTLEELQILNVARNKLTYIGNSSYMLGVLEEFYLNDNNIIAIEKNVFQKLTKLKILNLDNNKIRLISTFMFNNLNSLRELYLQKNQIKSIDSLSFNGLDQLITLDLSNNNFLNQISNYTFFACNNLRYLNLSYSNISKLEFQAFPTNANFQYLDLSFNKIEILQSHAFEGLANLKTLNLSYNPIKVISEDIFTSFDQLSVLLLSGNNLTIKGKLFEAMSQLEHLSFIGGQKLNLELLNFYSFRLRSLKFINTTIRSLGEEFFSGISLTPEVSLCKNKRARFLNFCHIGLQSLKPIAFLDFYFITFSSYDFSSNELTYIAGNTFQDMTDVNLLNLSYNDIQVIDSFAFNNISLTEDCINSSIYLNFNNISSIASNTFINITNLIELNLEHSNITKIRNNAFQRVEFCENDDATINLNGNYIDQLQEKTFSGISNLKILLINHNILATIDPKTFSPLNKLHLLDLSYNNLSVIPSKTFFKMNDLQTLNLNHNKIFKLTPESFTGLNKLVGLGITQNLIEDLSVGTFKHFPLLERLKLEGNYLSKVNIGTFSNLEQLSYLDLSNNKFKILDVSIFYSLQKLNFLELTHNMLVHINVTLLLDHLSSLKRISLNDNRWNCKLLINMLTSFKSRHVSYLPVETIQHNVENIEGIACNETERGSDEYYTQSVATNSESSLEFKFSKFIKNSDDNMKQLLSDVATIVNETKIIEGGNSNLVAEVQKLVNISNEQKNQLPIEMKEILLKSTENNRNLSSQTFLMQKLLESSISNSNSNLLAAVQTLVNISNEQKNQLPIEMKEILLKSTENNRSLSSQTFLMQKILENSISNSNLLAAVQTLVNISNEQKNQLPIENFIGNSNNTLVNIVPLYLVLLVSIVIACILGLFVYKQSTHNRHTNQRLELQLIDSN